MRVSGYGMGSRTSIRKVDILVEVFNSNGYLLITNMGLYILEVRSGIKVGENLK